MPPGQPPVDPDDDHLLENLGVEIPNDLSALDDERDRLLQGAAPESPTPPPSAPGMPRFLRTRRWREYGLSGPLVVGVLVAVALVGSLMTVLKPNQGEIPRALALATGDRPTGEPGGLLPQTTIALDGVALDLRRVRPAVIAVVPADCPDCVAILTNAHQQAREFKLRLMLLGEQNQLDQLRTLAREASGGNAGVAVDLTGGATATFAARTVTLVLVHADGVIAGIVDDPTPTQRLEFLLADLPLAGAKP